MLFDPVALISRQAAASLWTRAASVPSRKYKAQFSRSVLRTEYAMRFPMTGATGSVLLISSVGRSAHLCHAFEGLDTSGGGSFRCRAAQRRPQ